MTKYTIINWKKDKHPEREIFPRREEDISFEISDGNNTNLFVCDNCFSVFTSRNINHLEKCRLEWPYQDSILCKLIPNYKIKIYRIEKESDKINKSIVQAIYKLSGLSKGEQGLGLTIVNRGLLGKIDRGLSKSSKHYYYVLF